MLTSGKLDIDIQTLLVSDCGMNISRVTWTEVWTFLRSSRLEYGYSWVHTYLDMDLLRSHRLAYSYFQGDTNWSWTPVDHTDWGVETPWLTQSGMDHGIVHTPVCDSTIIHIYFCEWFCQHCNSHPIISDCSLQVTSSDHFEVFISSVIFIPNI